MRLRQILSTLILAFAALPPLQVLADDLDLHTTLLGQGREDPNDRNEFPFSGYFGAEYARPSWDLTGETDMRVFHDWERGWDDYDLYQAVLHVRPTEVVQIDFGRQFLNQGFTTEVADALKLTLRPAWPVEFTTYMGIPRTVERGDFNENDGLLSGLSVRIKDIPRTNIQVHSAWRKADIRRGDAGVNDAVLVGIDASHLFKGSWKPLVYGLAEVNATGRVMETGTVGFDLYPVRWAAFNAEFNYFNTDRDFARQSILGLFTEGRVLSGRIGSTWTIIPDYLDMEQSYSYQSLEVVNGDRRNGHLLEILFPTTFEDIGLTVGPGYYFSKSFGGDLHGVRFSAHEQFTKKFYAELGIDNTTYDKTTGDDDNAFSFGVWSGYEVAKDLILSAGFEYNKNNLFNRDIRGSFKLQYRYALF